MNTERGEKNEPPPARGRWQFSLRRMFVATTAVAILFSLASWGGWVKSDVVVYLSAAVLAGVFSRNARRCLLRACVLLGIIYLTALLEHLMRPPRFGLSVGDVDRLEPCSTVSLVFCLAVFLRAYSRAKIWSLAGALVVAELLIMAAIFGMLRRNYGCSTLCDLCFGSAVPSKGPEEFTRSLFWAQFADQRWYIVAPWVFGVAVGETLTRVRHIGRSRPRGL
jgi:hypothetical protein